MNENFIYGAFGGILAELVALYQLRMEAPQAVPVYLSSKFYWLVTIAMILAGGALVLIYARSGFEFKPIIAVNIGASAPLIIGSMIKSKPPNID